MQTDDLDFELPPELIAQVPAARRTDSRLLHYRRADGSIHHQKFSDLPMLLRAGDLLAFNDSRVLPARFALRKATGGLIEGLFLSEVEIGRRRVPLRDLGSPAMGMILTFDSDPAISVKILENHGDGEFLVEISPSISAVTLLERFGRMPLPPYIRRSRLHDPRDEEDRSRYQTVYAQSPGSVAAPTAGLHFTDELLKALDTAGIERTFVTLQVGMGTFKPITATTLDAHVMHRESYSISSETAQALNRAKSERRRIIAVGTTSRALESNAKDIPFAATSSTTDIFIYPPYRWKHVDALITNFHLPRSTLIALVAAIAGLDEQRRIYREAIEARYRFFSYGDAMLID